MCVLAPKGEDTQNKNTLNARLLDWYFLISFLAPQETGRQETILGVSLEDTLIFVLAPQGEGHSRIRAPEILEW